jgi:formylglycine-generating enzyme required for sulfatase activity
MVVCLFLLFLVLSCTGQHSAGPAPDPGIQSFKGVPESVELGDEVVLEAQFSHGSGRIEPGGLILEGSGKLTVKPGTATRYTLTVTSPEGRTVTRTAAVAMGPGLAIRILGLEGAAAQVQVEGPGGYTRTMTEAGVLTRLSAGEYTIQAAAVAKGAERFHPQQPLQKITVSSGTEAKVRYLPPRFTVDLPGGVPMEFVVIPAGTFTMGTDDPVQLADGSGPKPGPAHSVTLSRAFYLARYPTTRAQWWSVAGKAPAQSRYRPDSAMDEVSYLDIQERFLPALERCAPGNGFSLPSEAEWEYACRAGTQSVYFFGDDETGAEAFFWRRDTMGGGEHPVGSRRPNPWGLYDLAGLCLQWCEDFGHDGYLGAPADGGPWLDPPEAADYRILRGGIDYRGHGRSARRFAKPSMQPAIFFGFRLKAAGPGLGPASPDHAPIPGGKR